MKPKERAARVPNIDGCLRSITAALLAVGATGVCAAPQDGVVRAGDAAIRQSGNRTVIQQTSQRAVIDWRSFSIEANERVRFAQPSASASALNRVTGDQVSRILGRLTANGQVILVNPNGIVFGDKARVDVGSLIATTSRLGDGKLAGYMERGVLEFEPGRPGAGVVQRGTITAAEGGLVALVAPHVRNDGLIQARLGRVILAAGDTYTIDLHGDGLIGLALGEQHKDRLLGEDGAPVRALVNQRGNIEATGGKAVLIAAADAKAVLDEVINLSGVVRADTARANGRGNIVLAAGGGSGAQATGSITVDGADGTVLVSGQLLARGKGSQGGTMEVSAGTLRLAGSAYFDASGQQSAGSLRLSGLAAVNQTEADVIGRTLRTGTHTTIASDATFDLNARIDGRGTGASGNLSIVAARDLKFFSDVLNNGAVEVTSTGGAVDMIPSSVPLDVDGRVNPLIYAGDAPIAVLASGPVGLFELITSGDVSVESQTGFVFLQAMLGFALGQPLGSLSVRALGPEPGVAEVTMADVRVAPGGTVSVEASGNVRIFADWTGQTGLAEADARSPGSVRVRSEVFGDLWNNPDFRADPLRWYFSPGPDEDFTTLGDNDWDPEAPGLIPPGPTARLPKMAPLSLIVPAEEVLVAAPAEEVPLQDAGGTSPPAVSPSGDRQTGAPPVAGPGATPSEAGPPATLFAAGSGSPPAGERPDVVPPVASSDTRPDALASSDSEAQLSSGPGLPAQTPAGEWFLLAGESSQVAPNAISSGGRGIVSIADMGRGSTGVDTDVFAAAHHVVEGPVCEGRGTHVYFGSDAFGATIGGCN